MACCGRGVKQLWAKDANARLPWRDAPIIAGVSNSADLPSSRIAAPPLVDPGWLFLLAGAAILAACVLIPAIEDAAEARFRRDQVLAVEKHREVRLSRYEEFIGAVDARDPRLLISLAESQLNQIPADRGAVAMEMGGGGVAGFAATTNASIFPSLEPPPLVLPKREKVVSRLEAMATDEGSRKWMLIVGAVSVLIGLVGWMGPSRR